MLKELANTDSGRSRGPGRARTMKAVRLYGRGGPGSFVYENVPIPELRPGDALVRVHAAGISPAEFTWRIYDTPDGKSRLPTIPSHEVSGSIVALPPEEKDLQVGEGVYGLTDFFRDGCAAEYIAVRATELARKPRTIGYAATAATPLSALTAWQALFDHARLAPSHRVLVHGASGGVGSFTIQLARWRGARVIAMSSARDMDFVRQLGAHEVYDYRTTPFEAVVCDVDVVIDTVGGAITQRSWSVLRSGGMLVTIVRPQSREWDDGRAPKGVFFVVVPSRTQLNELSRLIDAGVVRPIVDSVLPLTQTHSAYEHGMKNHPRGKLVVSVAGDDDCPSGTC